MVNELPVYSHGNGIVPFCLAIEFQTTGARARAYKGQELGAMHTVNYLFWGVEMSAILKPHVIGQNNSQQL